MSSHPVQPVHGILKEEPFSILPYIDEKTPMCPVKSTFISNGESSQVQSGFSTSGSAEKEDIEYYTISGKKPYFNLILGKSHVSRPYRVSLPSQITSELPCALGPIVLTSCGKSWNTFYKGDGSRTRFVWKTFAIDNDLKIGDCCFFELMECTTTKLEFKVIILRGSLPFGEGVGEGDSQETAIIIE